MTSFFLVLAMGTVVWIKNGGWKKNEERKWFPKAVENFCVNEMCLKKTGGLWMISEAGVEIPADGEVVESTIFRLEEIILDDLVSENEGRFGGLGIGAEEIVLLKAENKSLEIGDITGKYDGTYVRQEGGDGVYKVKIVLDKDDLSSVSYWQKKSLTNLPVLQIGKMVIERDGDKKELVAGEDGWSEADEDLVDVMSNVMVSQYLSNFVAEGEEYRVAIETERDKVEFWVGKKKETKDIIYWGSEDKKYYFVIEKEIFEVIRKTWLGLK